MDMLTLHDIGQGFKFPGSTPLYGDRTGLIMAKFEHSSRMIAERIRERLGQVNVADFCCGVGGVSVVLAQHAAHVYGVDRNPDRLHYAKLNAERQGLAHKTTWLHDDVFSPTLADRLVRNDVRAIVADVGFLTQYDSYDPDDLPWARTVDETTPSARALSKFLQSHVVQNIVLHLPPTIPTAAIHEAWPDCQIMAFGAQATISTGPEKFRTTVQSVERGSPDKRGSPGRREGNFSGELYYNIVFLGDLA